MALKELAVQGCALSYSAPVTGPSASFTTPPSTKVKAESNGVYKHNSSVLIPVGVTDGTCTTTVTGSGNMSASSQKNNVEGEKPLRVDDSVTVNGITGVLSGGGGCSLNVTVNISNAGQTKVKGE